MREERASLATRVAMALLRRGKTTTTWPTSRAEARRVMRGKGEPANRWAPRRVGRGPAPPSELAQWRERQRGRGRR